MKSKLKFIGGAIALGTVSLMALAFVSGLAPRAGQPATGRIVATHAVSVDAPQTKFGIKEALLPDSAPPAMAVDAAAAAASEAASAASEVSMDKPGKIPSSRLPPTAIIPGMPKIAYTYDYGYQIGADGMSALQRRHADYCERQGPQVCRILSLAQSGERGEGASGTLELAVAAPRARAFGAELAKSVEAAGGKEIGSAISGEDLSKDIVDTEARLRARTVLRDRLMDVLATRRGTVAELIEAERGVADVNQEIDEARSWLNEMQGRVEFSRVSIHYQAGAPATSSFLDPVRQTVGSLGGVFGRMLALFIVLVAVFGPIGVLAWGARKLWLRYRPVPLVQAEA